MTISPAQVITATSRFLTWASSCPSTASTSLSLSRVRSPRVTATTAFFGLRPVAKALGTWVSMIAIFFGLGMSYIWARRSIVECSRGSSCADTSLAPVDMRTSLSDMKYWMSTPIRANPSIRIGERPAHNSSPMNATQTPASINIVKNIRRVRPVSLP